MAELFDELRLPPDRGTLATDIEGVAPRFAALLERLEARTAPMALIAESTSDETLRARICSSIVDRQKVLVMEGRARAQQRGELPTENDPEAAARTGVSAEPVAPDWTMAFTTLLLNSLTASTTARRSPRLPGHSHPPPNSHQTSFPRETDVPRS